MIYYICETCNEPAFYLKHRVLRGEQIFVQDIFTNGRWHPVKGKSAKCQSCLRTLQSFGVDRIMDNLEYVEYLAKQRNLV